MDNSKRKFQGHDIEVYLGLHVWFGLFQLPQLSDYWHAEPFLRGGIEVLMPESRFMTLDANFVGNNSLRQVGAQFRRVFLPDQELVLVRSSLKNLYLFDARTSFLLDILHD